jgi:putative ABC transport system permease protein
MNTMVKLSIRPLLSALLRSRAAATLVALQIAVALAVLANAAGIVHQRIATMSVPTGIDDANLFGVESVEFTKHFDYDASLQDDLAYLRGLPGVVSATPTNALPLSENGTTAAYWSLPDFKGRRALVSVFTMDEQGLATLGARLVAGRGFRADEIGTPNHSDKLLQPPQVIVTRATAERLFPHEHALGRTVYFGFNHPARITGILANMIGLGYAGSDQERQVVIVPQLPRLSGFNYLVRTAPGRRDALMAAVERHLSASNPDRVIRSVHSLEYYRQRLYLNDRAMALLLMGVTALMLVVACLGVFALATFSVGARTRQIGTRRAVGARRIDIVRHFLIENALITTAGIVLGCVLTLGAGYLLSLRYAVPRLDLLYLAGGALVIGILGQAAAWWPARRAAQVPPSVATR